MTAYPDIRPVPRHIPRPAYVPANFFDAGWGDHDEVPEIPVPSQEAGRLDQLGVEGARRAGRLAAEILGEAGKLVKVGFDVVHRTSLMLMTAWDHDGRD